MEVGICLGACNNSPAESAGPENGRCLSQMPIVNHVTKLRLACVGMRGDGD